MESGDRRSTEDGRRAGDSASGWDGDFCLVDGWRPLGRLRPNRDGSPPEWGALRAPRGGALRALNAAVGGSGS